MPLTTKAKDLGRGDVFRMHVYGEVLAIEPVAGGKRVRVKVALEGQAEGFNAVPVPHGLDPVTWSSLTTVMS